VEVVPQTDEEEYGWSVGSPGRFDRSRSRSNPILYTSSARVLAPPSAAGLRGTAAADSERKVGTGLSHRSILGRRVGPVRVCDGCYRLQLTSQPGSVAGQSFSSTRHPSVAVSSDSGALPSPESTPADGALTVTVEQPMTDQQNAGAHTEAGLGVVNGPRRHSAFGM